MHIREVGRADDRWRCIIHDCHCKAARGGVLVVGSVSSGVCDSRRADGESVTGIVVGGQDATRTIVAGGRSSPTCNLVAGEPARAGEHGSITRATANRRRLVVSDSYVEAARGAAVGIARGDGNVCHTFVEGGSAASAGAAAGGCASEGVGQRGGRAGAAGGGGIGYCGRAKTRGSIGRRP